MLHRRLVKLNGRLIQRLCRNFEVKISFFFCSSHFPQHRLIFIDKLPSFTGHSKSISIPASQESASGNQIVLTTDESNNIRLPIVTSTTTALTPTRPKALTIIPDETHV